MELVWIFGFCLVLLRLVYSGKKLGLKWLVHRTHTCPEAGELVLLVLLSTCLDHLLDQQAIWRLLFPPTQWTGKTGWRTA